MKREGHARTTRVERFAQQNRECAAIILAEPERYGGPGSLMVQWAHLVLDDRERAAREWRLAA